MKQRNKKNIEEKILSRVAIYVRVSTERQAKEGDSMRDQLATGQKYINERENMILVDEYVDGGISGQKTKRDEFQRFANCIHVTSDMSEIVAMKFKPVGETICYAGKLYEIISITDRNLYFHHYCIEETEKHKDILKKTTEDMPVLVEELKKISEKRKAHVKEVIDLYDMHQIGFYFLASKSRGTIFETISEMLLSPEYKFWSGLNGKMPAKAQKLVVTYSSMIVLSHLEITPNEIGRAHV